MSQNQAHIKTILEAHAAINRIADDVKAKYKADVAVIQEQINNPFSNGTEVKTATTLSNDQMRQEVAKVFNDINSATTLEGLKVAVEEFNTKQSTIPKEFITDPNVASKKAAEITVSAIKNAASVAEVDSAVAEFNKYRYQGSKDQVQAEAGAKKASLLRVQSTTVDDEIKAAVGAINKANTMDEIKTIVDAFSRKKLSLLMVHQFTVPTAASKRAADITIAAINAASDEAGVNAAVATFMSDSNTFKGDQLRVVAALTAKRETIVSGNQAIADKFKGYLQLKAKGNLPAKKLTTTNLDKWKRNIQGQTNLTIKPEEQAIWNKAIDEVIAKKKQNYGLTGGRSTRRASKHNRSTRKRRSTS
jgi:hypothetical protein